MVYFQSFQRQRVKIRYKWNHCTPYERQYNFSRNVLQSFVWEIALYTYQCGWVQEECSSKCCSGQNLIVSTKWSVRGWVCGCVHAHRTCSLKVVQLQCGPRTLGWIYGFLFYSNSHLVNCPLEIKGSLIFSFGVQSICRLGDPCLVVSSPNLSQLWSDHWVESQITDWVRFLILLHT